MSKIIVEGLFDVFPKHEGRMFFVSEDGSNYAAQMEKANAYAVELIDRPRATQVTMIDTDGLKVVLHQHTPPPVERPIFQRFAFWRFLM